MLPRASATLSLIVCTPGPTSVPGGGTCETPELAPTPPTVPPACGGQLSAEVTWARKSGTAVWQRLAPVKPGCDGRFTVIGGGHVRAGGVVSPKKRQVG